jgi:hypothetical protein
MSGARIANSEGISITRPTKPLSASREGDLREKEELAMATVTVRFRGICCFIDPTNGESFKKRVVLPNGGNHHHVGMEAHVPIIEFFADDLKSAPSDVERISYTRPGDDGQYQRIELEEPVMIELLNAEMGAITPGPNFEDSVIHLDSLMSEKLELKRTLLGPAASVSPALAAAVIDLPGGTLMAGPPESSVTRFPAPVKFQPRRIARWLEHIVDVKGAFGLQLTSLRDPEAPPRQIWFKDTTRLITIGNEPMRAIVGHFVPRAEGAVAADEPQHGGHDGDADAPRLQATGHFDIYWDLIADPPFRPVPEPFQTTGPGCGPATKP